MPLGLVMVQDESNNRLAWAYEKKDGGEGADVCNISTEVLQY